MIERRLAMDELGDAFGSEVAEALEMGRFLEASIEATTLDLRGVEAGFDVATEARGGLGDRIMAALADEPAPTPTGFLLPLRRRGFLGGLWASFRQASVATHGSGRPLLGRAAALAYVLVLTFAGISVTGAATAGALGLLGPDPTVSPEPTPPAPTLAPPQPTQQQPSQVVPPTVLPTPSPTPTASPSETPEGSDDSSGPGGGGNSGPGSSSSGSGSGSQSDSGSGSRSASGSGSGSDSSGPGPGPTSTTSGGD